VNLLASHDCIQVLLPELSKESESGITIVQVYQDFNAENFPEVLYGDAAQSLLEPNVGVEGKYCAVVDEIAEGVTVEMVSVSQIGGKIRIRPVGGNKTYDTSRSSDPVKFADNLHGIADVFDNVAADDLVELAVGKGIGKIVQIMNDVGICPRINVHSDCARDLVGSATDVQDLTDGSLLCPAGQIR
jgi:hypothetical protein